MLRPCVHPLDAREKQPGSHSCQATRRAGAAVPNAPFPCSTSRICHARPPASACRPVGSAIYSLPLPICHAAGAHGAPAVPCCTMRVLQQRHRTRRDAEPSRLASASINQGIAEMPSAPPVRPASCLSPCGIYYGGCRSIDRSGRQHRRARRAPRQPPRSVGRPKSMWPTYTHPTIAQRCSSARQQGHNAHANTASSTAGR